MQKIQLNIIPFSPIEDKKTFAFYSERKKGFKPIRWNKLFAEFPEGREARLQNYYTDFQPPREDAFEKEIVFTKAISFSLHYFRHIILNYFKGISETIVFQNFTDDVEVWIEDPSIDNETYRQYSKFTIKPQYNEVTSGYEIVLAYNNHSKILKKSIAEIADFDTHKYNLVNCNGAICKYENMPEEERQQQESLFPVLSNELKADFDVDPDEINIVNRYKPYLWHIQQFYKNYLNTPDFKSIINIDESGFYIVPENRVFHITHNSNELQFLNGTEVNPGLGIYKHKPLKAFTKNHVKLFFIYHKPDGGLIKETLYEFITKGWKKNVKDVPKFFKNLQNYINQPLSIDKEKRIVFENTETIYEEVSAQLKNFVAEPNTTYLAVYVTPISKFDKEHPQHAAYYKIKELLLNLGISSQVVYKENLDKEDFYYFLPNIYVAMLAKIGGIPWRLARTKEEEIIIGIGAFKPMWSKHRFVGSAFCFSNEGIFEGFDCYRDDEPLMLAGKIREVVNTFIENNKQAKRVIIHFYKEISDQYELKPILDMLESIGAGDIPVIVVTINKTDSQELIGFDLNSTGKMPLSGTYISVGFYKFLLFNNIRYSLDDKLKEKDYHFPVKLRIQSSNQGILKNNEVIEDLIDQVYQFSRMYWKSISQQNLPVTIKYPEMVAKIYPHFQDDKLPEFGQNSLWFL